MDLVSWGISDLGGRGQLKNETIGMQILIRVWLAKYVHWKHTHTCLHTPINKVFHGDRNKVVMNIKLLQSLE